MASKAPKLTLSQLKALGPCEPRMEALSNKLWKRKAMTAADAVRLGATLKDIACVATRVARTDKDAERRLRMWAADCAARVLHIYEDKYIGDERPRNAIIAARKYANGLISESDFDAARAAGGAADWAPSWDAAMDAAAWAAARDGDWEAEREWQLHRLVQWFSDEEPEPVALPEPQKRKVA